MHSKNNWIKVVQGEVWSSELDSLKKRIETETVQSHSSSQPLSDILRVGGHQENAKLSFDSRHAIIMPASHQLVKLLIHTEHVRLLHAGHLLTSDLSLKTVLRRWWSQSYSINHTQLCYLQATPTQTQFSTHAITSQGMSYS